MPANPCHYTSPGHYWITPRDLPRRECCIANSVGLDPAGWYRVHASVDGTDSAANLATVRFTLDVHDVFRSSWQRLKWRDLSTMHGRRIHVSAVADDLSAAWHVHPVEANLHLNDETFTVHLQLPPKPAGAGASDSGLPLHLLFNFGILADEVGLCVDESASHIDPGPGGQQLVTEGQAQSRGHVLPWAGGGGRDVATTAGGAGAAAAAAGTGDVGGAGDFRTVATLALGGVGNDDIVQGAPITTALEDACVAAARGSSSGEGDGASGDGASGNGADGSRDGRRAECWSAKLSAGMLWPALRSLPQTLTRYQSAARQRLHGGSLTVDLLMKSTLNATLFPGADALAESAGARAAGTAAGAKAAAAGAASRAWQPLQAAALVPDARTPACLGLNVFVWRHSAVDGGTADGGGGGSSHSAGSGVEQQASGAFEPYLTMAAHGIIASLVYTERLSPLLGTARSLPLAPARSAPCARPAPSGRCFG